MPMNWTPEADAKLLLGILALNADVKVNYAELAQYMGSDCTAKAVSHRIANLKKKSQSANVGLENGASATTPTKTVKRKVKTEDDDDDTNTPTKKTKTVKQKGKTKKNAVKNEVVEEQDENEDELAHEDSDATETGD